MFYRIMKLVEDSFKDYTLASFDIDQFIKFEKILEENTPDYLNGSNIVFLQRFISEHFKNPSMKKHLLKRMGYDNVQEAKTQGNDHSVGKGKLFFRRYYMV